MVDDDSESDDDNNDGFGDNDDSDDDGDNDHGESDNDKHLPLAPPRDNESQVLGGANSLARIPLGPGVRWWRVWVHLTGQAHLIHQVEIKKKKKMKNKQFFFKV